MTPLRPYKKDSETSYTLGAFPTMELINCRPELVEAVYLHSTFEDSAGVEKRCRELGISVQSGADHVIQRVSPKENVFVAAVFRKFESELAPDAPHLLLDHPGDMGNLGTIIRTAAGLGVKDVAIITPAADRFAPRTVRASMGALFRVRTRSYKSWEDYAADFPDREVYTFMLDGARPLDTATRPKSRAFTMVFGNEATGLAHEYASRGTSVFIPQTKDVDSLNLPVACAIGMFVLTRE